jgi:hypothetical protein
VDVADSALVISLGAEIVTVLETVTSRVFVTDAILVTVTAEVTLMIFLADFTNETVEVEAIDRGLPALLIRVRVDDTAVENDVVTLLTTVAVTLDVALRLW